MKPTALVDSDFRSRQSFSEHLFQMAAQLVIFDKEWKADTYSFVKIFILLGRL